MRGTHNPIKFMPVDVCFSCASILLPPLSNVYNNVRGTRDCLVTCDLCWGGNIRLCTINPDEATWQLAVEERARRGERLGQAATNTYKELRKKEKEEASRASEAAARLAAEASALAAEEAERKAKMDAQALVTKSQAELAAEKKAKTDAQAQLTKAQADLEAERKVKTDAQAQLTKTQAELETERKAKTEAQAHATKTQAELTTERRAKTDAHAQTTKTQAELEAEKKAKTEAEERAKKAQEDLASATELVNREHALIESLLKSLHSTEVESIETEETLERKVIATSEFLEKTTLCEIMQRDLIIEAQRSMIIDTNDFGQMVELFLRDDPKLLDKPDEKGLTFLMHATLKQSAPVMKFLLSKGARVDLLDATGRMPIHMTENCQVMELLLKAHKSQEVSIDALFKDQTVLMHAAERGDAEMVVLLLKYKASVEGLGSQKNTCLHVAVMLKRVEILKLLLQSDEMHTILDCKNAEGKTALMMAVQGEDIESVDLLLQQKASVEETDSESNTVLHMGASSGNLEILTKLLQHKCVKAIIDKENANKETVLVIAAKADTKADNRPMIEAILKAKSSDASPGKSISGASPLSKSMTDASPLKPSIKLATVLKDLAELEDSDELDAVKEHISDAAGAVRKKKFTEAKMELEKAVTQMKALTMPDLLRQVEEVMQSLSESSAPGISPQLGVPLESASGSESSSSSSAPKGLLSDDLPSLGATYKSDQISIVLASMLSAAEVSDVKAMEPIKIVLGAENSTALDDLAKDLFSAKTLIWPIEMELSSKEGSHWVFLIIDAAKGTVKLVETENSHEAAVKDFLSHSLLRTWEFASIDVGHQQYSDSCGVEGIGHVIAHLKNITEIDPASAAVVQSITYLDYLTSALGSIFNADHFYRVKDFVLDQLNKAANFALDTNNQALLVDLFHQANSLQGICPLPLGGHPFKPDHDDPDGNYGGGDDPHKDDADQNPFAFFGAQPDQDRVELAGKDQNATFAKGSHT